MPYTRQQFETQLLARQWRRRAIGGVRSSAQAQQRIAAIWREKSVERQTWRRETSRRWIRLDSTASPSDEWCATAREPRRQTLRRRCHPPQCTQWSRRSRWGTRTARWLAPGSTAVQTPDTSRTRSPFRRRKRSYKSNSTVSLGALWRIQWQNDPNYYISECKPYE